MRVIIKTQCKDSTYFGNNKIFLKIIFGLAHFWYGACLFEKEIIPLWCLLETEDYL